MRIPGLKGLRQSVRWLRSRRGEAALILGYHRVTDAAHDPFSMCVAPQRFAEHLEILRRYARPIPLRELAGALSSGRLPSRAVAITLDDGYADALYQARPLLERYQIPATVFVTTGSLGREFWWDELARLLTPAKRDAPAPGFPPLLTLHRRLLSASPAAREQALAQIRGRAEYTGEAQACPRALTPGELEELAGAGLIEIGAHTITHPLLATLSPAAQRVEIKTSKLVLEELLGQPVTGFSYPNGSWSKQVAGLVQEAGYAYACAGGNDVVGREHSLFRLPRFWMPDWDGETFARWLKRWLPD